VADPANYPFPFKSDQVARPVPFMPRDLAALLCAPGYMSPNDWRPQTVVAVLLGEAGGDPLARGQVVWAPGSPTHLSIDLGLFQLNSYYHTVTGPYPSVPPITVADCFDPFKSRDQAWQVMIRDRPDTWHYNLKPWTVYKTGAYDVHMSAARQGLLDYRAWLAS
jgi:hypothetical protein